VLLDQIEVQAKEYAFFGKAYRDLGAVFTTVEGNWIHPSALAAGLNAIIKVLAPSPASRRLSAARRVGVPENMRVLEAATRAGETLPSMRVHDLRHTFVTLSLRRGVPIELVSKLLGPSRPSITLNFYRHVVESERRDLAVDLFEAPIPDRITRVIAVA
jgi:integrase